MDIHHYTINMVSASLAKTNVDYVLESAANS